MTFLHEAYGFVVPVVGYCWSLMEDATDAVTSIRAHYAVSTWLNCVSNDVSDLTVHLIRGTVLNRVHQTFICLLDECLARLCNIANQISLIQITVEALVVCSHV